MGHEAIRGKRGINIRSESFRGLFPRSNRLLVQLRVLSVIHLLRNGGAVFEMHSFLFPLMEASGEIRTGNVLWKKKK